MLPQFNGMGEIIAWKQVEKIIYFIDLEEVDHEDVKLRLLAQSPSREVRN